MDFSFFSWRQEVQHVKKHLLQRFNVRQVTDLGFLPRAMIMAPLCSGVASDQVLPAGPRPGACWQPRTWAAQHGSWSQGAGRWDGLRRKISLLGFTAVSLELTFSQQVALLELCFHGELFNEKITDQPNITAGCCQYRAELRLFHRSELFSAYTVLSP